MSFVPGLGIAKGMALTLRRFFMPKATIQYPEVEADVAVRFRGRLQLLYDEWGALKCETCFQCAQACPIECIDMGGFDTKGRFHIHWGPPETYGERREESALRRSGRTVPDPAYSHFDPIDLGPVDRILAEHDYDPADMLAILESVQAEYGFIPIAAVKQISHVTGAWYAFIYGTATYYRHLRFEARAHTVAVCRCTSCLLAGSGRIAGALGEAAEGHGTGDGARGGEPGTRIALETLAGHLPGAASPLVVLDGEPQLGITEASAASWGRALSGRTPA